MSDPTNDDDVIDSRDVIERLADLEQRADPLVEDDDALEPLDDEERAELDVLRALAREGESFPDWAYGVTLVRDSYFEDYARELAEEIGAINPDAAWPLSYIDWERAADALQMDYTSVEFDGVTYWAR